MFNWFKKSQPYPTLPDISDMQRVADDMNKILPIDNTVSTVDDSPCYQIGKTTSGSTTLRVGTNNAFTTVTMNNAGVDTLIRMLEAAKEPELLDEDESSDDGS